ncbi:farnesyl cysteine-carboxyl methyltransferase [Maublancomyces gigas]|uniref:Protein-S-isoprenylcysteine O-methyltransferase n=1 Tax=Discina gigas TaxID=1032678 RepID=A0ABR3GMH3_9PEZI
MASFTSDPDWTPFPQRSSSRSYGVSRSTQFEPAAYLYPNHQFALDGIALRAGLLGAATAGAFLLTSNGMAYNIAHASAFTEAAVEWYFFPGLKTHRALTAFGVILVILGQLARSYAMAHAGTNFSHVVVMNREQGHILVKTGIYAYIRHPSYFGFFWWGMGTQFMLGNPVCAVGYALALWKFFSSRIREEEKLLIGFFGEDYVQYRATTMTLIPFIK